MSQLSLRTPAGGTINITAEDTAVSKTLTLPAGDGEVFNQSNILGTVSQTGGVPTGAIIEGGSNANGKYVKYADGTMVCYHPVAGSADGNPSWTFPVEFAASPEVVATIINNDNSIRVSYAKTITTTAVVFRVNVGTTINNSGSPLSAIAYGRWF